jgi:hypothetical protein
MGLHDELAILNGIAPGKEDYLILAILINHLTFFYVELFCLE